MNPDQTPQSEFLPLAVMESMKHTHHTPEQRKCRICGKNGRADRYCTCYSAADIAAAEAFIANRPH